MAHSNRRHGLEFDYNKKDPQRDRQRCTSHAVVPIPSARCMPVWGRGYPASSRSIHQMLCQWGLPPVRSHVRCSGGGGGYPLSGLMSGGGYPCRVPCQVWGGGFPLFCLVPCQVRATPCPVPCQVGSGVGSYPPVQSHVR